MKRICGLGKCTGCGACYNICRFGAIKMVLNNEGFLEPKVDPEKCVNCGQCIAVCPANKFSGPRRNKIPKVYLSWVKNQRLRYKSSSGGAFVLFANYILDLGGKVYGAVYTKDFLVEIVSVGEKKGLKAMQGSKYVQSNTLKTFKQVEKDLKAKKNVLYAALPCQIAGLYAYLKRDYDKLYTLDLVCHGAPSVGLFENYLKHTEKELNDKISYINQKEPNKKWTSLISFNIKIKTKLGMEVYRNFQNDPYINAFSKSLSFNKCCYGCKYASLPRVGDISLGDFGGLGVLYKYSGEDTSSGVSQVLVNSSKGENLFKEVRKNAYCQRRKLKECVSFNRNVWRPTKWNLKRDFFYEDFKKMSFEELDKKYMSGNFKSKIIGYVKLFIIKIFGGINVNKLMYLYSRVRGDVFK